MPPNPQLSQWLATVWSVEEGMGGSSAVNTTAPSRIAGITAWQAPRRVEMTLLQESDIHNKLQRSRRGEVFSTIQYTWGETAPSACLSFQGSWMPAKHWHFWELVNARYSIFAGAGSRLWKNFSQEKRMLFRFAASLNIGLLSCISLSSDTYSFLLSFSSTPRHTNKNKWVVN